MTTRARRYCVKCSVVYETTANNMSDRCPACQAADRAEAQAHARQHPSRRADHPRVVAKVIDDPDPECGFPPGAGFDLLDTGLMLRAHAFTNGTVLEIAGSRYTVASPYLTGPDGATYAVWQYKIAKLVRSHHANHHP